MPTCSCFPVALSAAPRLHCGPRSGTCTESQGVADLVFFCDQGRVCFDCANNDNSRGSANKPHGGWVCASDQSSPSGALTQRVRGEGIFHGLPVMARSCEEWKPSGRSVRSCGVCTSIISLDNFQFVLTDSQHVSVAPWLRRRNSGQIEHVPRAEYGVTRCCASILAASELST